MEERDYESEYRNETLAEYHRRTHDNSSTYGYYFENPETCGEFNFSDERKNH